MDEENPKLLKLAKKVMLMSGSWRLNLTSSGLLQTLYNFYSVLAQGYFIVLLLCMAAKVPAFWGQDTSKFIETVGYVTTVSIIASKLAICQTSTVGKLLTRLIEDEKKIYLYHPKKLVENYQICVKHAYKINTILLLACLGTFLSLSLANFLVYLQNITSKTTFIDKHLNPRVPVDQYIFINETLNLKKVLPFAIWLPFDTDHYYGFSIFLVISFLFIVSVFNVVTQVLFITLMVYITAQLKGLQILAKDFHDYAKSELGNDDEKVIECLRKLVFRHQDVIGYTADFNGSVKNVMLQEFLLNSLNLASAMFQIPRVINSLIFLIFYLIFLVMLIMQLFFLAWTANEIKVQSGALSDALFESKWYIQTQRAKKIIYIIMMRAQKPLTISIGSFYPMTLSVALTSVKAAYSYVTMMAGFSGDP